MPSSKEYLNFILEQLSGLDGITCRPMMGEYIIYFHGKIIGGIYDNRFLVKPVRAATELMPDATFELPYEGAKPMLMVEDIDNKDFLAELLNAVFDELPAPKGKGKKMSFDYKKEYKEFYMPPKTPTIVSVPPMNYIAVRGRGDPNDENGEYKQSIGLLYAIAFTVKMSKLGAHQIEGYFDYVVPPLEGFWWQDGVTGIDYSRKEDFKWISLIRLPDFMTKAEFDWAVAEAEKKEHMDLSKAEFLTYDEGLCVQCMHIGSYDSEPATIGLMHSFIEREGYALDISDKRFHHEIYLSDARRTAPEKLKTVIRHPIK